MALRLADYVISAEIYHSPPYSVHGCLVLGGCDMPIVVDLTGLPAEDLRECGFELTVPENDRPATNEDVQLISKVHRQQIGSLGEMTAARMVQSFDFPEEELLRAEQGGALPAMKWKRSLYIEWFSQAGRVVLELTDPQLRFVDPNAPVERPVEFESVDYESPSDETHSSEAAEISPEESEESYG